MTAGDTDQGTLNAAGGAPTNGQSFFVRQSSGLVREISFGSSLALNFAFMSVPYAVLVATQAPFAFPGSSPFLIMVISAALCIAPAALYSMFMAMMPRSGGEYVFISRTVNPWVGMAASFNINAWYLLVISDLAFTVAPFGLSSAFSAIGAATHNQSLITAATDVTSKGWEFGIGAGCLVLTGLMMVLPLRRMLQIFKVLFAISILGVFLAILLLLIHGRSDFQHDVTRLGGSYGGVIASAHKAGFTGGGSFNLGNTILATPLGFAAFGYSFLIAYAGGEVRSAVNRGRHSMVLSVLIAAVVLAITMALATHTFGNNFLGSATYLSNNGSKAYPFSSPSFFFFWISTLTTSTPLIVIINLSFVAAILVTLPATFLIVTRTIFAWSFDRVLPDKLNEVNERTRSPIIATVVVLIVTLGYLTLMTFGSKTFLDLLYAASLAELLTLLVVAVTGILLPFMRKRLYGDAPFKRPYLFGIPSITIIGVLSLGAYGLFFYSVATTDALGANGHTGVMATVIIAAIAILIYPVSWLINRSRGVNLSLAFKELPPE
jgi:APA family basic amino acid/polyamine antiporter